MRVILFLKVQTTQVQILSCMYWQKLVYSSPVQSKTQVQSLSFPECPSPRKKLRVFPHEIVHSSVTILQSLYSRGPGAWLFIQQKKINRKNRKKKEKGKEILDLRSRTVYQDAFKTINDSQKMKFISKEGGVNMRYFPFCSRGDRV